MGDNAFVVAGCPLKNRLWCAERHAYSLASQSRRPDALFWLLNDDTERTGVGLCNGVLQVNDCPPGTIEHFDTGDTGYSRIAVNGTPRYSIANLATVRNKWVERALALWPHLTHLWSVDSDVLPDADVLSLLLDADLPVVAAVVANNADSTVYNYMCGWSRQQPSIDGEVVQPRRNGDEALRLLRTDPFAVSMTGACVLIRRDVVDTATAYCMCYDDHVQGEDIAFSIEAQRYGFMLAVHPLARTSHVQHSGEVWR